MLTAAEFKTRVEVLGLLAAPFPQPGAPPLITPITAAAAGTPVTAPVPRSEAASAAELRQLAPAPVVPTVAAEAPQSQVPLPISPEVAPLSPGHFSLQLTVDEATRERLRDAHELLGHAVPTDDVARAIERALQLLAGG